MKKKKSQPKSQIIQLGTFHQLGIIPHKYTSLIFLNSGPVITGIRIEVLLIWISNKYNLLTYHDDNCIGTGGIAKFCQGKTVRKTQKHGIIILHVSNTVKK